MQVQYHLSLAHSLAVWEFRKAKEEGYVREDAKIGLINCFAPPYTREDPTPEDLEALRDGGWDQQPVVAGSGGRRTSARGRSFYWKKKVWLRKEGREMKRY